MTAPLLTMIAPAAVRDVWPLVRRRLEQLSENEAWMAEDVFHDLVTGNAYLWCTEDHAGFVVLTIMVNPYSRDLHVWIAHNSSEASAPEFVDQLRTIARDNQCKQITFESGRPGWRRVLAGARVRQLYILDVT